MNECINLQNLCSWYNTYTKEDIQGLINLKRIYSWDDTYKNDESCFLYRLFTNNKLIYVHIENYILESKIVDSITLSKNIIDLRYLYIYQEQIKYNIILNITKEFPIGMIVFDVKCNGKDEFQHINRVYGEVAGNDEDIARLKRNLIHQLNRNQ